jgi:hypothetical protein
MIGRTSVHELYRIGRWNPMTTGENLVPNSSISKPQVIESA